MSRSVEVPSSVKQPENDYVRYLYRKLNDGESEDAVNMTKVDDICFKRIMSILEEVEIECQPRHEESKRLKNEDIKRWLNVCKDNNMIPKDVEVYEKECEVRLKIPGGQYDRHTVYGILCCYRYADSWPKMVWQMLRHLAEFRECTFWQIFHYGLVNHFTYALHSFTPLSKQSKLYGSRVVEDLSQSIALKLFFSKTLENRKILEKENMSSLMENIASKLGGVVEKKIEILNPSTNRTESRNVFVPVLRASSIEDILTNKWTKLYEFDNPSKDMLLQEYNKIEEQSKNKV